MRTQSLILALALVPALAAPAAAQTHNDERRWEDAQARYRTETRIYERERDRYEAARERDSERYQDESDDYSTDYDAARDYREGEGYAERRLTAEDEVYRGSDGRYYCKRGDGTTGLIIGGATGGILGNVIDGGRRRGVGTLIGGALGALAGKSIAENSNVRCR